MRTLGQFLSVLFLIGVVVHWFWWLSGVVVVFGLVWWVERWWRQQEVRREAWRVADAETAARAVQQDQWLLQGDPRGLFGEHTPAC